MYSFKAKKISNLEKNWLFIAEDNFEYKNLSRSQSNWIDSSPYFSWQLKHPQYKDYFGVAWYRLYFTPDTGSQRNGFAIFLPYSYGAWQLYLNGKLVEESNPWQNDTPPQKGARPRVIEIPGEKLRSGENLFALRVAAFDGWGGFVMNLKVAPKEEMRGYWTQILLRYFAIPTVFIFLFFYFLVFYFLRRREPYYLWLALVNFSLSLHLPGVLGMLMYLQDSVWFYRVPAFLGGILLQFTLLNFLHSFLQLKKRWLARAFEGLIVFAAAFVVIEMLFSARIDLFVRYLYMPFMIVTLFMPFYLLFVTLLAMRKKVPYARHILWGILFLVLALLWDVFVSAGIVDTDISFIGEGNLAMVLAFTYVLALRYSRASDELETANVKLQSVDKLKDDFLANASHELQTPLNGIMGMVEILLHNPKGRFNRTERHRLSLVALNARRLNSLVHDILDFSRLRNDDLRIFARPVDMRVAISIVIDVMNVQIGKKNVSLRIDVAEGLPLVLADEDRVQQILFNLVGNAVKFTREGEVVLKARVEGSDLIVDVEDNGIGIPKEKQGIIFESFTQGDAGIARNYGGTGLGLSITRDLLEAMNGRIWVESEEGQGATFSFALPLAGEGAEFEESGKDSEIALSRILPDFTENPVEAIEKNQRVETKDGLIFAVDDDSTNLEVIEGFLEQTGYTLRYFNSPREVLDVIQSGEIPDLILLDIMMPEISGYDITTEVRKEHSISELPIIMLTARSRVHDMLDGYQLGANDYLVKPFLRDELLVRVEAHITIKRISDEVRDLNENLEHKVEQRTRELQAAHHELQETYRKVHDSIDYGSRIQAAVLPHWEVFQRILPQSFIFFRPQATVSGDFYWLRQVGKKTVLAVADSTGHGVPGAMVSMLGISYLNEIILQSKESELIPGLLLDQLREKIKNALQQRGEAMEQRDGMDMSLCVIDPDQKLMHFSGAYLSLYFVKNGVLREVKGDTMPVAIHRRERPFTTHELPYEKGDSVYLLTDGFIHQNSEADENQMFGKKRLEKLFRNIYKLSPEKQQEQLATEFNQWKGTLLQRDDVLLVGFRF